MDNDVYESIYASRLFNELLIHSVSLLQDMQNIKRYHMDQYKKNHDLTVTKS